MSDIVKQAQEQFSKFKSQVEELESKENEKIATFLESISKPVSSMRSQWDGAKEQLTSKLSSLMGPASEALQKAQSALGGQFGGDMINKAMSMLTGDVEGKLQEVLGQFDEKLGMVESELGQTLGKAQELFSQFREGNSNEKMRQFFSDFQQGLGSTISADPSAMFTPLEGLKNQMMDGYRDVQEQANVMSEGLPQIQQIMSAMPSNFGLDLNGLTDNFNHLSELMQTATESATLAQSELQNRGTMNSGNVDNLVSSLQSVVGQIDSSGQLGVIKQMSGIQNFMSKLSKTLESAQEKLEPILGQASGFLDNLGKLNTNLPGNPLAKLQAGKLSAIRNELNTAKSVLPGVAGKMAELLNENDVIYSSSGSLRNLSDVADGFGRTMQTNPVKTDKTMKLAQIKSVASIIPDFQKIKDSCNASLLNIDLAKTTNPIDVLNPLAGVFSAQGKQAADTLKSIAENQNTRDLVNQVKASALDMRKSVDNYLTGNASIEQLSSKLTQMAPQLEGIKTVADSAISQLKQVSAPFSQNMSNLMGAVKNADLEGAADAMMSGDFCKVLMSAWTDHSKIQQANQSLNALKGNLSALGVDTAKIDADVKTLQNRMQMSVRKARNLINDFSVRAERVVNEASIRDTSNKRMKKMLASLEKELKRASKA